MAAFTDMKIKALRMFSHFHLGTVSQGEIKVVKKEIGEALIGLHLAEALEDASSDENSSRPAKKVVKGGNKPAADGADKDAPQS